MRVSHPGCLVTHYQHLNQTVCTPVFVMYHQCDDSCESSFEKFYPIRYVKNICITTLRAWGYRDK